MANTNTISKDGLAPEVIAYIDSLEAENNALATTLDDATGDLSKANDKIKELEESDSDDDDDPKVKKGEELLKSADPAIVKMFEDMQAKNEELAKSAQSAEEIAKAERDQRVEKEFISKAADFDIATDTEALGRALKAINENCDEAVYQTVETVLKAAAEQIEKGNLFIESGTDKGRTVSKAEDDIDAKAKALVEKSDGKLSYSQAVTQIVKSNPSLYDDHTGGK